VSIGELALKKVSSGTHRPRPCAGEREVRVLPLEARERTRNVCAAGALKKASR
jgi:hypothetical protein